MTALALAECSAHPLAASAARPEKQATEPALPERQFSPHVELDPPHPFFSTDGRDKKIRQSLVAAEVPIEKLPAADQRVRSVLLTRMVNIAHWQVCLQQRVIHGRRQWRRF